jgi:hypothetical protein
VSTILVGLALVFFAWALYRFVVITQAAASHADDEVETGDDAELAELISRKRLALFNIKEMELDYATGKIGDADYNAVRRGAETETIELMEALDAQRKRLHFQDEIDRELEARAAAPPAAQAASDPGVLADAGVILADDGLTTASAAAIARRQLRDGRDHVRCGQCGARIETTDKFCRECGTPRVAPDAEPARSGEPTTP